MVDGSSGSGFADLLTHFWSYVNLVGILLISWGFHKFAKWLFSGEGKRSKQEILEIQETVEFKRTVTITKKQIRP